MAGTDKILDQEELDFLLRGARPGIPGSGEAGQAEGASPAADAGGNGAAPVVSRGQQEAGTEIRRSPGTARQTSAGGGRMPDDGPPLPGERLRAAPVPGRAATRPEPDPDGRRPDAARLRPCLASALLRFCHGLGAALSSRSGIFLRLTVAGGRLGPWADLRQGLDGPAVLFDLAPSEGRLLLVLPERETRGLVSAGLYPPDAGAAEEGKRALTPAELARLDSLLEPAPALLTAALEPSGAVAAIRPACPSAAGLYLTGDKGATLCVRCRMETRSSWGGLALLMPAFDMENLQEALDRMPAAFRREL